MTASSTETLYFHCHACGVRLSVPATLAGVSGPCPNCATTLVAPTISERYKPTVSPTSPSHADTVESVLQASSKNELVQPAKPVEPVQHVSHQQREIRGETLISGNVADTPQPAHPINGNGDNSLANVQDQHPNNGVTNADSQAAPAHQLRGGSQGRVDLPTKRGATESAADSPQSTLKPITVSQQEEVGIAEQRKTVLPNPRPRIASDEQGMPIWRPPVEGDGHGYLLTEPYESSSAGRASIFLIALFFILAAVAGLAFVFKDQLMLLWGTYKMRTEQAAAARASKSNVTDLPAPSEIRTDMLEEGHSSSATSRTVTDSQLAPASASVTFPPQPTVAEIPENIADLPSAVADAIVVQSQSDLPEESSKTFTEAVIIKPDESGVFVPRSISSKQLIAKGAPFAEADSWVMDAPADRPPFSEPPLLPEFLKNPPEELKEPVETIKDFLMANTWEERLKHVLWPEQIRPLMRIYYQQRDDGPLEVQHADVLPVEPSSDSSRSQYVFLIGGKDMPQPVPFMVEKTPTGWKADWAIFVEGREKLLEKFFLEKGEMSAPFRVFVRRKRYFGNDVPDLDNKLCYEIQPPAQGFIGHAFADKRSPIAQTLDRYLGWEVMNAPVVMELRWRKENDGGWMEIVGLTHENWRTPKMEAKLLK